MAVGTRQCLVPTTQIQNKTMSDLQSEFLKKVDQFIEENLGDEHFGVSELAEAIGINRSSLLRNIKKETQLSTSQYIRQVRLEHGMELLKQKSLTVSEISFKVGFNSPSYFVKCFREFYGYPPGEVGKRDIPDKKPNTTPKNKKYYPITLAGIGVGLVALLFFFWPSASKKEVTKKSIAVLPFVNNSSDSNNVYFINGLMESILNNLQKIEDLKVVSRTSVEKYRNGSKSMSEIAQELGVNYLVEGSGQKVGDQVLLHVQLIEGVNDHHIWSKEYSRQMEDVFQLQGDISKKIAKQIQVIITPEEENQIDKPLTNNVKAYDLFLKGMSHFHTRNQQGYETAISYYKQAIEEDENFAAGHALIANSYYLLDLFQTDKKYHEDINFYADKALLLDPELPQSLIAKAQYYMHSSEYTLAESYLLKAYEYQPNSALTVNILSDFYTNYSPNTAKYLTYALKGIQLNIGANDSSAASFIYLHVSNALIQNGFVDEALYYNDKSLAFNPENPFSGYLRAFILYPKTKDIDQTINILLEEYQKDTTRMDILQNLAKVYYYKRDFDNAYLHYSNFLAVREKYNLDMFRYENAIIGEVMIRAGKVEKGMQLFEDYKKWADTDHSIYKELALATYYIHHKEYDRALKTMKKFSEQEGYHYWTILFLRDDPLVDPIKNHPDFIQIVTQLESKFWDRHEKMRISLEEEGLLKTVLN